MVALVILFSFKKVSGGTVTATSHDAPCLELSTSRQHLFSYFA